MWSVSGACYAIRLPTFGLTTLKVSYGMAKWLPGMKWIGKEVTTIMVYFVLYTVSMNMRSEQLLNA